MANSSGTDLKKKASLRQKERSSQIIPTVTKNKKVGSSTEIGKYNR